MNELKLDEKNVGIVTSCYSGSHKQEPKLLSALNDNFAAEQCNVTKYEIKSSSKSTITFSLDINKNRSSIIMPSICFKFPTLCATSSNACVGYCSLPAINIIETIKIWSPSLTFETLNALTLKVALKKTFKHNFDYWAKNWLGGIDGKNQKVEFCENFSKSNILKEGFSCILPLPFDLFRNEELYRPELNKNNGHSLQITVCLKELSRILTFNKIFQTTMQSNEFEITVYTQDLMLSPDIFNNCIHMFPDKLNKKAYISADESFEYNFLGEQLKFSLKELPTTEYFAQISSEAFNAKNWFLGDSNESARENYWASMLKPSYSDGKDAPIILLKSGKFFTNRTLSTVYKNYEIIPNDDKSFALKYDSGNDEKSFTLISFSIPLENFSEKFCLDIFNFILKQENSFFLRPEYFSHVHFHIERYNPFNVKHKTDSANSDGQGCDVPLSYYQFTLDNVSYVFTKVTTSKNPITNDELFDIAACVPIGSFSSQTLSYVNKRFLHINKMFWPYYDLDGKHRIEVHSLKIFDQVIEEEHLELDKQIQNFNFKYNFEEFQIHRVLKYLRNDRETLGFIIPKKDSIEINLKEKYIKFDKLDEKIDSFLNNVGMKFNLSLVQVLLKHLKYKENQPLVNVNKRDYDLMAKEIIEHDTEEDGIFSNFHTPQKIIEEDDEHIYNITTKHISFKKTVLDDFPNKKFKVFREI